MCNQTVKQKNYRWVVLGLATWAQASATFVTYGVGPLAAIWQLKFSLSQSQAGLLVSVVNIGPLLSMLLIGRALDQYGERWITGIGSVLLGLTVGFASFLNNYGTLLCLLFLVGIHYGTAQPGGSKVVIKWFDSTERGFAMGIRQSGIPIGGALAGWVIPVLSSRYDWPVAVGMQAIFAIAGGLAFLFFYREPFASNKRSIENYRFWGELKKLCRQKQLHPLLFSGFILVSLQIVLVAHLMIFLKSTMKQITLVSAGQMLSVCLWSGMVGRILLAWLSDKLWTGDRIRPLMLSICSSVIGLLALVVLPHDSPVWALFILCAWLGFFGIGWYSLFIVEIAEKSSRYAIGLTVSYALTLNQIAIITAPLVFGLLVDWQGSYQFAWIILAILLSVSACWLWSSWHQGKFSN
ncbi:MFS transporter [Thermoactinomyces sp. CICC 10521]|nr:MFS transporter [Thermoactinomyces sp. CICC 10521]